MAQTGAHEQAEFGEQPGVGNVCSRVDGNNGRRRCWACRDGSRRTRMLSMAPLASMHALGVM
jgi:hypothetical protein